MRECLDVRPGVIAGLAELVGVNRADGEVDLRIAAPGELASPIVAWAGRCARAAKSGRTARTKSTAWLRTSQRHAGSNAGRGDSMWTSLTHRSAVQRSMSSAAGIRCFAYARR
jgi:anti-sigma-K factor RskA